MVLINIFNSYTQVPLTKKMKETDHFYNTKEEPNKSCLLSLRTIILKQDKSITETKKIWNALFLLQEENVLLFMGRQKNK